MKYVRGPTNDWPRLEMVEAGADAVIGSHPMSSKKRKSWRKLASRRMDLSLTAWEILFSTNLERTAAIGLALKLFIDAIRLEGGRSNTDSSRTSSQKSFHLPRVEILIESYSSRTSLGQDFDVIRSPVILSKLGKREVWVV